MGNLGNFNIEENEQENNFDVLPKGIYEACITASSVKNTKAGTGKYLAVEFTIFEEEFAGRKVFANFNIQNESEKAQKIGLGQLSALCKACGKTGIVDDSSELHDLPVLIKVDVGEYNNQPKNEVKGFAPKSGASGSYNMETKEITLNDKASVASFKDDEIPFS